MGLETAPQNPLGRIDPSMVVPRSDPSLNSPSATAAMIDAFRNGQITANDIADRALKHPAMEAAVKNATDPQLVEARKAQEMAGSQEAVIKAQQMKELANVPASVLPYYQAAVQAGVMAPVDLKKWTDADTQRTIKAAGDLLEFHRESAKAKMLTGSIVSKPKEDPVTHNVYDVPTSHTTGAELNPEAAKAVNTWDVQYGTNPVKWIQAGKPPVHEDLFAAPGAITAPTTGAATPTGRLVKTGDEKAPTAQQAQAGMFAARALGADEVLKNLQQAGFNPASTQNWLQDFLIGPLGAFKTGERKAYDAAKNEWTQGLLRLESGAAISNKEQSWYEKTFFPTAFDPPAVQDQKAKMRADVEIIANQMAKTGRLDVPALMNVEGRANLIHDLSKSGVLTGGTNSSLQKVNLGGKTGRWDPANNRIIWESAPAASKPYVAPTSLRGDKISVESK